MQRRKVIHVHESRRDSGSASALNRSTLRLALHRTLRWRTFPLRSTLETQGTLLRACCLQSARSAHVRPYSRPRPLLRPTLGAVGLLRRPKTPHKQGPARRPALFQRHKTPASRRNAHCFGLFFAVDRGRTCRPILFSLRAAWHRIGATASANAPHVLRYSRHRRPPGSWR